MTKIKRDTNTREYWHEAIADPSKHLLTAEQARAMRDSLDLGDPEYWNEVLRNPKKHGFSRDQALALSDHFLRRGQDVLEPTEQQRREGLADYWTGYQDEDRVRTIVAMTAVLPLDAVLLFYDRSLADHQGWESSLGESAVAMKRAFDELHEDGRHRALIDWAHYAISRGLSGPGLAGWTACCEVAKSVKPRSDNATLRAPRLQVMRQNEERVVEALRNSGFDPMNLPALKRGKGCPAKAAARSGAGLSVDAFDHAWKRITKRRRT